MFYAEEQTDMTKLTVVFLNFANAPKNYRNALVGRKENCSMLNLVVHKETKSL